MKTTISLILCSLFIGCTKEKDTLAQQKAALDERAALKIKKIAALLHAECDSSLQRETYRRVQLLQKSKWQPKRK